MTSAKNESSVVRFTPAMVVDLFMQAHDLGADLSPAEVEAKVDELLTGPFEVLRSSRDQIIEEVLRRIRVRIGEASTLANDVDHVEWLPEVDRSGWQLWPRLDRHLRRTQSLPPAILQELHRSTDKVLGKLESPDREGRWDRRGMVVGHVQSGKTTHYTAVAAKALDAGYQIVIILAGVHNSLRSQTHERIDHQLIGRDSAALLEALRGRADQAGVKLVGVGQESLQQGEPELPFTILTCTTSNDHGDFKAGVANQAGIQPSHGSRLVMVVKKNASILRNLINWLRAQNTLPGRYGDDRRITAPALIVDDEADHASVNTAKDMDTDPTTINRRIRELLLAFDRVGFVGYTATPFANIFIPHEVDHDDYGADVFPSAFIVNLQKPSNHLGPAEVFGHPGDESANIPEQAPLPMHVSVDDAEDWIPDRHKRDCIPGPVPGSLKEAIRLFILNCAARACQGEDDAHNSMLVHVTRFVDVQARVATQVEEELTTLRNLLGHGAKANRQPLANEFKRIWDEHIVQHHKVFLQRVEDQCSPLPEWDDLWSHVEVALHRMQVMRINGQSGDALAYSRNPEGLYVIAIGGDKLSRGLTLEGLSVSYFLRASSMFDTLMQMGRWFGYRPGYAHLCRVYTTPLLHNSFREIALATDELRSELDYMETIRGTPKDFGLRVRTPSDGLMITAGNKIRRGEKVEVRFAGELVQALMIPQSERGQAALNREATRHLIESLGEAKRDTRGKPTAHYLWHGVDVDRVLEFLGEYEAFATPSFYKRCEALQNYIRQQNAKEELLHWTVAVVSKRGGREAASVRIGGHDIPLVTRKLKQDSPADRFDTQAVVGSADEALDLQPDEFEKAIIRSPSPDSSTVCTIPARSVARDVRPVERGLLLLYLIQDKRSPDTGLFVPAPAISFPTSSTAKPLAYTVNEVWREQYGLTDDWDDATDFE